MGYKEQQETLIDSELLNIPAMKDNLELTSKATGNRLYIEMSGNPALTKQEMQEYINKVLPHTYVMTNGLFEIITPKHKSYWFKRTTGVKHECLRKLTK